MNNLDKLIKPLIEENQKYKDIKIPSNTEGKKHLYRALRNVRKPKPIPKEYLKMQDEYLKAEIQKKGIIDEKEIKKEYECISIWQGDITRLKIDAIVNAGNGYLLGCFNPQHHCIDNEIHSFAGMQLREKCNEIMQGKILPNGEVVLTSAYNLPSKYIIHTVGPKAHKNISEKDRKKLKNCYWNSLELCKNKKIKTIAFPCIATGIYSFPQKEACEIAFETILEFIKKYPKEFNHIIFNVFKEEDAILYKKKMDSIKKLEENEK